MSKKNSSLDEQSNEGTVAEASLSETKSKDVLNQILSRRQQGVVPPSEESRLVEEDETEDEEGNVGAV